MTLAALPGRGQVDKKYKYTYDFSGNRTSRTPVPIIQSINLIAGWNIFSANVLPENRDLKALVQPLIDAGKLVRVITLCFQLINKCFHFYTGYII